MAREMLYRSRGFKPSERSVVAFMHMPAYGVAGPRYTWDANVWRTTLGTATTGDIWQVPLYEWAIVRATGLSETALRRRLAWARKGWSVRIGLRTDFFEADFGIVSDDPDAGWYELVP